MIAGIGYVQGAAMLGNQQPARRLELRLRSSGAAYTGSRRGSAVTTFDAVGVLRLAVPKSYGDEQLSGRLTGAPKP